MVKKLKEEITADVKEMNYDPTYDEYYDQKSQSFREVIYPETWKIPMTLSNLEEEIQRLLRIYGKYWRLIQVVGVKFNKDNSVSIDLDCYR